MKRWLFSHPPYVAALTTTRILDYGYPILHITPDSDYGCWQFLCGTTDDPRHARIVTFAHIVELDPSITELGDLPLGWQAHRADASSPWTRKPSNDQRAALKWRWG